jgi:TRAP-type C4-dicarboxylate transport system substrate-binding protein
MRTLVLPLTLVLAVAFPSTAPAEVVIKLGTVAPEGSPLHRKLREMGDLWEKDSNGQVKLKIYPGGVAGDESDMIRKLRVGQLQAAALTVVGLHDVAPVVQGMITPAMFRTEEDVQCVLDKVTPTYQKALQQAGFVVLTWADTGWVYFFSSKEVRIPGDAKGLKIFTWAGDPGVIDVWRKAGMQPTVLSINDMTTSLATGMVNSFAISPIVAFTTRWYERAKFMTDVPWSRLAGAIVVTQETWNKIPADVRPKILEDARVKGKEINDAVQRMGASAIKAMEKNGLKVVHLSEAERQQWFTFGEGLWPTVRGGMVPADSFDQVKKARDDCHAKK